MSRNLGILLLILFVPLEFFVLLVLYDRQEPQTLNVVDEEVAVIPKVGQPARESFTILLVGDVMLGRNVRNESVKNSDFSYPFLLTSEILSGSTITFVNLESPAVTDCPVFMSGYVFCSPPEAISALKKAGVDIVNLANNHALNFGESGLQETKDFLDKQGISHTGFGNFVIKEVASVKLGFLGFDFTVRQPGQADYAFIQTANQKVDKLVVAVHWGVEYEDSPRDFQKEWATDMVNSGADIIVGHHPHWVQGAECFENGTSLGYTKADELEEFVCIGNKVPVYYSLGNFIFDQMWSEETKKGALVKLNLESTNISSQEVLRTYIRAAGQPEIVATSNSASQ